MASDLNIGSGAAAGLIAFLDHVVTKGWSTPGVVSPLRTAARKILETVDGSEWSTVDVRSISVDDYMSRFGNKQRGRYTRESLRAYESRFRRALDWYGEFLTTPGWQPPKASGGAPRARHISDTARSRSPSADGVSQAMPPSTDVPATPRAGLIAYPFPLRSGVLAYLYLPAVLPSTEAKRIAAFVDSLAIDVPHHATPDQSSGHEHDGSR